MPTYFAVFSLTYDRDLVPLFAVLQVAEHGGSEHQNDQNDPSVSQSGKSRNPAKLCLGVDNPTVLEPAGFSQKTIQKVMICMAT